MLLFDVSPSSQLQKFQHTRLLYSTNLRKVIICDIGRIDYHESRKIPIIT
jgi:hypothetical protein